MFQRLCVHFYVPTRESRRRAGCGRGRDNWQRLFCSQRCVNLILLCCTQLEWFLRGPAGGEGSLGAQPMSLTIRRTAPQGRVAHNHMRRQQGRGGAQGNAVTEGRIKLNYNFAQWRSARWGSWGQCGTKNSRKMYSQAQRERERERRIEREGRGDSEHSNCLAKRAFSYPKKLCRH